ncbi:MAG: YkgJ family cysteine cluster protein [Lachnospiraceae bacterium]|nr:YkgJ family cysteine cluster protein [Lachnospiraceae bacterium]
MKRNVSLDEISDGKLYQLNDMVKADCADCRGCSSCCKGMGNSIVLDPYDVYRLSIATGKSFQQLLTDHLDLSMKDGVILPTLRMVGEEESCSFLSKEGRCEIHTYRPGICRLFPLGRFYENHSFQYFLQIHECEKKNRLKIKVHKWIDTKDPIRYDAYILDWHYYLNDFSEKILAASSEEEQKELIKYILLQYYYKGFETDQDFYEQFYHRRNYTPFV